MQLHNQPHCSPVLEQAIDRHLLTVAPDTPVSEVIASLKSGDLSRCALVMEGSRLVGLFSEYDIIPLNQAQMSLEKIKVADVMTTPIITLNISNLPEIFILSSLLQQHQIHHLPVVGDRDQIVGIVTPQSICRVLEKEISNLKSASANLKSPKGEWGSITQDSSRGSDKVGLLAPNASRRKQLEAGWQQVTEKLATIVEAPANSLKKTYETLSVKIAEEQQTFKALLEREKQYKSVVDNVKEVFFQTDTAGLWTFLNPAWTEITGFSIEESIGTNFLNYIHPDDRQHNLELFQLLINREKDYCQHEMRYLTKNGNNRWIEVHAKLTLADNNTILGTCGKLNDITERKQAAKALQESEERFRQLAENIDEVFWMTNPDKTQVIYISPAFEKIWGRACESLYNNPESWLESIYPEDRDRILALIRNNPQGTLNEEYRILRPDGSVRWIWDRAFPVRNAAGKICRITGLAEDITERKLAQQTLLRISAAVEKSSDAIGICGVNAELIYVNQAFRNLFGYSLDDLNASGGLALLFTQKAVNQEVFATVGSGKSWRGEVEMRSRSGCIIQISLRTDAIKDTSAQVVGSIAILTDITERLQAEQALRESEEKFRNLVEQTNDWVWEIDSNGVFTYVSPKASEITGYQVGEIHGKTTFDFMSPDEAKRFKSVLNYFVSAQQPFSNLEKTLIHKNGHSIVLESSGSPVFESQGVLQGYRGISRDITERKKADSEIRSSLEKEKELNELKSRFVSMISHEFRTPLSTILLYTELLEHYHHKWDEEQKRQYFLRIQTAIKNMTNLLDDVLIIGKAEVGKIEFSPTFLNIDAFCRDLVSEMQLTAGSQHTIIFQSSGCCQKTYLDEKLLRQILTNLLSNSLKYSPQGGIINFSYYFQNEKLVFEVQDEGIGIPIEDQQHLFESFHRATNVGTIPGTGLGLAIVKECVKLHQGEISVNSQLGLGTRFVVKLPYQLEMEN